MSRDEWKREEPGWYTRGGDAISRETRNSSKHHEWADGPGWYRWHDLAGRWTGPHKTMREAMEARP